MKIQRVKCAFTVLLTAALSGSGKISYLVPCAVAVAVVVAL
jgi:hypothetical protein